MTTPLPERSLLDGGDVPVSQLAAFARREARRPRPIYGAHKWFARRLGTAFRGLLVAAATPAGGDFWAGYYGDVSLHGHLVLDTFVGGGTALVEAQRLGATVVGVDVDPVAAAVTRFELSAENQPNPQTILAALQASVGARMARFHRTTNEDGSQQDVVHHFWVQVVDCTSCGEAVEAHPTWQIATDQGAKRQWVLCRGCGGILERPAQRQSVRCGACHVLTNISAGTVAFGKLTCPGCGTAQRLIDVALRTGRPPAWRLFALEVLDTQPTGRSVPMAHRSFRRATRADQELVEDAARELKRREDAGLDYVPEDVIPHDRVDDRLVRYGYQRYRDLFNHRQLLHLSLLAEEICALPPEQRGLAALALSNHLTTTCMMTSYAAGWRRLVPLFSVRAFRHVPRPVEVNPWLSGTGRGTYPNAMRQIAAAIAFAQAPREFHTQGFVAVPQHQPAAAARVLCQSSERLDTIPDSSVSLVLSDPPYLDNIAYSELADFFAPWLRRLQVIEPVPKDRARTTNLAAGGRSSDDSRTFAERLGRCFQEASRVLSDDGRVVFTYQHSTANGWYALAQALASSELESVNVMPLQGDGGFGLHAHEGTSVFDAILILRRPHNLGTSGPRRGLRAGQAGLPELTLSAAGARTARDHAGTWTRRLAAEIPGVYRTPDATNLLRACLVAAALREVDETPPDRLPLLRLLENAAEVPTTAITTAGE